MHIVDTEKRTTIEEWIARNSVIYVNVELKTTSLLRWVAKRPSSLVSNSCAMFTVRDAGIGLGVVIPTTVVAYKKRVIVVACAGVRGCEKPWPVRQRTCRIKLQRRRNA